MGFAACDATAPFIDVLNGIGLAWQLIKVKLQESTGRYRSLIQLRNSGFSGKWGLKDGLLSLSA
jgi:hypothetical protein